MKSIAHGFDGIKDESLGLVDSGIGQPPHFRHRRSCKFSLYEPATARRRCRPRGSTCDSSNTELDGRAGARRCAFILRELEVYAGWQDGS